MLPVELGLRSVVKSSLNAGPAPTAEGQARFCYRSLANFTKVSKFGKVSPKFLYKKATVIVAVRTR